MLGDVAPPAVTDPGEGKLAHLLVWSRISADERAEQLQGPLSLLLAESADEQLQPLSRCHKPRLTISAITRWATVTGSWWEGSELSRSPRRGNALICGPHPTEFPQVRVLGAVSRKKSTDNTALPGTHRHRC